MKALKLSDLHVHLGACVPASDLYEMAKTNGLVLPKNVKNYHDFHEHILVGKQGEDHDKYLNRFQNIQNIQSSPTNIEKSVFCAISAAYRKSNITTIEIRFNPASRNLGNMYDLDSIITSACMGMIKACQVYPVKAGLIIETERSSDSKLASILASKAVKFKNLGICGFDVSGHSPENFKVDTFVEAFQIAKKGEIGTTFHTGEVTGPKEMWEILEKISPDRIGHGVKCVKDRELMDEISRRNIVLELCPTSNLRLGIIKDIDELHSIIESLKIHGVSWTVNSDGPTFLNTTVKDELLLLYDNKILDGTEVEIVVNRGHKSTFIKN